MLAPLGTRCPLGTLCEFFFFPTHPNPSLPRFAFGANPKLCRSSDHHFFQHPNVPNHVLANRAELQDRIPHRLPRPVVGNISPAASLVKLHVPPPQSILGNQKMLAIPV